MTDKSSKERVTAQGLRDAYAWLESTVVPTQAQWEMHSRTIRRAIYLLERPTHETKVVTHPNREEFWIARCDWLAERLDRYGIALHNLYFAGQQVRVTPEQIGTHTVLEVTARAKDLIEFNRRMDETWKVISAIEGQSPSKASGDLHSHGPESSCDTECMERAAKDNRA